jgi:exopolyphosphatase
LNTLFENWPAVDELPVKTWDMHHRIKGVVLVDHNVLEEAFGNTTVLSIMDHHVDRNQSMKASPRVIKMVGSCSSLVTLEMRRQREEAQKASKAKITPLPEELADLLLHTIAIDTKGAKKKKLEAEDKEALEWLWPASSWRSEKYEHRMKKIYQHMLAAQDDLSSLSIRDLLRRDFKGGPFVLPTSCAHSHQDVAGLRPWPSSTPR